MNKCRCYRVRMSVLSRADVGVIACGCIWPIFSKPLLFSTLRTVDPPSGALIRSIRSIGRDAWEGTRPRWILPLGSGPS